MATPPSCCPPRITWPITAYRRHLQLVFQPAEETGSGASKMIADGLFERFPVDAIYGLHNWPGVPVGHFGFVDGPAMASVDWARLKVIGKGGHGAEPQGSVDPILVAAHIITALQSVVSRNVDPRQMGVVTVGSIHGGQAANVIPDVVELKLTVRAYLPEVRDTLRRRVTGIAEQTAAAFGARAEIEFPRGFPSVINHPQQTAYIREVACRASARTGGARVRAAHRQRGLRLPAAGAAGQFRVRRQRRQRTAAQPALCVQRRRHRTRRQPVGAAGRRLSGEGRGMSSNERFSIPRWMIRWRGLCSMAWNRSTTAATPTCADASAAAPARSCSATRRRPSLRR
jgi:amidohydrolase